MATETLGSFVQLFIRNDGGRYHVAHEHWNEIDAAYTHWTERGIDRVLTLSCTNGSPVLLAVSRIGEMHLSTPESRQLDITLADALKAETGSFE